MRSRFEIHDILRREEQREHGPDAVDPHGDPFCPEKVQETGAEIRRPPVNLFVGRIPQDVQRRDSRGHGERVPREGARLVNGSGRGQMLQDGSVAADRADRQSSPDNLAQAGEVGADAGQGLPAAVCKTESGDHLVEDQKRAVLSRDFPQGFEESRARRHDPHVSGDRLDNDAGDLLPETGEYFANGVGIVEWNRNREFGQGSGDSRAPRDPERGDAGTRLDQQRVGMAVVAANELDDLFPARPAAGQANGGHGRLGSGTHHTDRFDGRKSGNDSLGHGDLRQGRRPIARPPAGRLTDGGDNLRSAVAEDHRPPGGDVVDVFPFILIDNPGAGGASDENRCAADGLKGPHGAVDSAGNDPLRL